MFVLHLSNRDPFGFLRLLGLLLLLADIDIDGAHETGALERQGYAARRTVVFDAMIGGQFLEHLALIDQILLVFFVFGAAHKCQGDHRLEIWNLAPVGAHHPDGGRPVQIAGGVLVGVRSVPPHMRNHINDRIVLGHVHGLLGQTNHRHIEKGCVCMCACVCR